MDDRFPLMNDLFLPVPKIQPDFSNFGKYRLVINLKLYHIVQTVLFEQFMLHTLQSAIDFDKNHLRIFIREDMNCCCYPAAIPLKYN